MDNKKLNPVQKTVVGVQFLFVAFGATVLVPLLVGMDPSVALFTAGIGTLIFHLVTKGKVPIFLGSSFAFIAPIIKATELYGLPGTLSGLSAVGAVYAIMSASWCVSAAWTSSSVCFLQWWWDLSSCSSVFHWLERVWIWPKVTGFWPLSRC